jgi:hypothetical protein
MDSSDMSNALIANVKTIKSNVTMKSVLIIKIYAIKYILKIKRIAAHSRTSCDADFQRQKSLILIPNPFATEQPIKQ